MSQGPDLNRGKADLQSHTPIRAFKEEIKEKEDLYRLYKEKKTEFEKWLKAEVSEKTVKNYLSSLDRLLKPNIFEPKDPENYHRNQIKEKKKIVRFSLRQKISSKLII